MNVATLDGQAGLTGVHEGSPDGAARGNVEIRVLEHQHGVFAAQFEDDWKQAFGGDLRDSPTGTDASGEDQLVNVAFHECRTCFAFAGQHMENVIGNSCLAQESL